MIAHEKSVILTRDILDSACAPDGSITAEQKNLIGVSGPKRKWRKKVVGQEFPESVIAKFIALREKNVHCPLFFTAKGESQHSLSINQENAIRAIKKWHDDKRSPQVFYLAGFAGTGKTFLAKHVASNIPNVVFAAFTGKAALVLRNKGCYGASTIHSLIYKAELDQDTDELVFVLNDESPAKLADLVIIDECSMVGNALAEDLLSFGKKVLVLGDPAQLPPVKDTGFFTNRPPDFMLTTIHRQAEDNPIIWLSKMIREGDRLPMGQFGESVVKRRKSISDDELNDAGQVLVGMNRTRRDMNEALREMRGFSGKGFREGEKLVCLRNNKDLGLMNGSLWNVDEVYHKRWDGQEMCVVSDDGGEAVDVDAHYAWMMGREDELSWRKQMQYQAFDYGYVLSVHKSQGSQWDDVLVYDESFVFRDDAKKHLYTAITRAAKRVTVGV